MRFKGFIVAGAVALSAFLQVHAACGNDVECDEAGPWGDFTAMTLTLSAPDSPGTATWKARFDNHRGDTLLDIDVKTPRGNVAGTLAVISGEVLLSKGIKLDPGYEIHALDGPLLNMRLVTSLLKRVVPGGPASIAGEKKIDRGDRHGIKFFTPSAGGRLPGPWHATGVVTKKASNRVGFDLTLDFVDEHGKKRADSDSMRFQGELAMDNRPVFADDLALDEWAAYRLGTRDEGDKSAKASDYGVRPVKGNRFKTVAEVRASLAEHAAR